MAVNVNPGDSRDELERERFHPFIPEHHLIPDILPKDMWYWSYNFHPAKQVMMQCPFPGRTSSFFSLWCLIYKFHYTHNYWNQGGVIIYWSPQSVWRSVCWWKLFLNLLPQYSCYLNEACWTWSLYRVDVCDILLGPRQWVLEFCPLFKILTEIVFLKLLFHFSSYLIECLKACLIFCDKTKVVYSSH